jgi:hypothetical protein
MRSCYVAIPFGVKPDDAGRMLDFDHLYWSVLQPTLQAVGMECRRLDELPPGAIWHKAMFTALISSDLMIADLSTHNANVLYELGVRHAMKRGRTLLISADRWLPGNLGYAQALWYQPDESGRLTGEPAGRFRDTLQASIRQSQRATVSDSPVYEFFPDLQVMLPPELEGERRPQRTPVKKRQSFAQSFVYSAASVASRSSRTSTFPNSTQTSPWSGVGCAAWVATCCISSRKRSRRRERTGAG